MARQMMALCDSNLHYGGRLVDYLERQQGFPYAVMHFSDTQQLKSYEEKQEMEYLILGEEQLPYLAGDTHIKKIFLLTKSKPGQAEDQARTKSDVQAGPETIPVYRYQPAGNIMRQILGSIGDRSCRDFAGEAGAEAGMKLIGIYTPVGRCMQTSFSLLLGQLLRAHKRTLYLNLEGYSGFRELLGRELKPDITDFMYFAGRDSPQFMAKLESMLDSVGGLEYLPPAAAFPDLQAVEEEQWMKLFRQLEEDGRFGYVILDLTEHVRGLFRILESCDLIYTIETGDPVGAAKLREYERMLELTECGNILKKTKKKRLPKLRRMDFDFDQLIYSELADYVKTLVKEDFGF